MTYRNDQMERKSYTRDLHHTTSEEHPRILANMIFTKEDLEGFTIPHHDLLVNILLIERKNEGRLRLTQVLEDTEASTNIMYSNTFLNEGDLTIGGPSIRGFGQKVIPIVNLFRLSVTLGS